MRSCFLFAAIALGALIAVSATPGPADACPPWARGSGYGYGYTPAMPAYYYPSATAYPAGPRYYTPGMPVQPPPRTMPPAPLTATPSMTVEAKDDMFSPATVNIQTGTTVKFVNNGKHAHTVTATNGEWDSGDLSPGSSFTATFIRPGTYKYYCRHHKGMEGTIVVGEPGKTPVGGGTGASKGPGY
ncbi:MAG TPA: cupredoxin domain-containing protein [Gemmataceae bacterium]|nr:cupredoxin domain-containing protein [Gemmataceae bacterium]